MTRRVARILVLLLLAGCPISCHGDAPAADAPPEDAPTDDMLDVGSVEMTPSEDTGEAA